MHSNSPEDDQHTDPEDEFDRASDDEMGDGLRRVRSAKVVGGRRLTGADYTKQENTKKGKYGITVPKPFAFDIRDATKSKGIRERKVEQMLEEKRVEEERIRKTAFRCKPIPPEVLQPRYHAIQQQNENRRLRVKQNSIVITREREQPFTFWERDKHKMAERRNSVDHVNAECTRPGFRANPIPKSCSVLIYQQKIEKEEQARQKRINEMAESSLAKARMPSRMQKD